MPNNRSPKQKINKGHTRQYEIGKCQFPLCCNFFTIESSVRIYCKHHPRTDTKNFTMCFKDIKTIGNWEIKTTVSIRKIRKTRK